MPDELDKYLAEQSEAENAELGEYIDKRLAWRSMRDPRAGAVARDRNSVVSQLEEGSEELEGIDKIIQSQETTPR